MTPRVVLKTVGTAFPVRAVIEPAGAPTPPSALLVPSPRRCTRTLVPFPAPGRGTVLPPVCPARTLVAPPVAAARPIVKPVAALPAGTVITGPTLGPLGTVITGPTLGPGPAPLALSPEPSSAGRALTASPTAAAGRVVKPIAAVPAGTIVSFEAAGPGLSGAAVISGRPVITTGTAKAFASLESVPPLVPVETADGTLEAFCLVRQRALALIACPFLGTTAALAGAVSASRPLFSGPALLGGAVGLE